VSIKVAFPWNEKTYLDAGEMVFDYRMQYTWRRYAGYVFIAMALYGLLTAVDRKDYALLYLGAVLSGYWYFMRPIINRQRLKRLFVKEPVHKASMEFVLSQGGIRINGHLVPWREISAVIVHPKGFLLERPQGYPYLPATAFGSDDDVEAFVSWVEANGIELRRVGG